MILVLLLFFVIDFCVCVFFFGGGGGGGFAGLVGAGVCNNDFWFMFDNTVNKAPGTFSCGCVILQSLSGDCI